MTLRSRVRRRATELLVVPGGTVVVELAGSIHKRLTAISKPVAVCRVLRLHSAFQPPARGELTRPEARERAKGALNKRIHR